MTPGKPLGAQLVDFETRRQLDALPSGARLESAAQLDGHQPVVAGSGASTAPLHGPGVLLLRFGDLRPGLLLVDSGSRAVLGRVLRVGKTHTDLRGKPRRTKLVIELEDDPR